MDSWIIRSFGGSKNVLGPPVSTNNGHDNYVTPVTSRP